MRVVSFSLWGANPKYCVGAVRNAELASQVYPGWQARFYVAESVPPRFIDELEWLGAKVVRMPGAGDRMGRFWRFLAASDPLVEVMVSRDCDSRLSAREKAAVDAWLASPALLHIMRDHPQHVAPIMAGMWGVKAPLLRDMAARIDAFTIPDRDQADQEFLAELYPSVAHLALALEHDDVRGVPFPTPRSGLQFVGEVFDEDDRTDPEHTAELMLSL